MEARRSIRVIVVLGTVLAVSLVAATAFAGISGPQPLRATRAEEQIPSSAGGFLAWAEYNRPFPRVRLRRPDGTIVRVNPAGTFGWPGGFDGRRLAYQRATRRDLGDSDIYLYNVKTGRTRGFPSSVNTPDWEWGPSISGDLIMFGRNHHGHGFRVMLFDRRTSELRQLAGPAGGTTLLVGQINGRYAVWTRAGDEGWDVIRYDLSTGAATRIPRPADVFAQYAPSVTSDGTVYFAAGGRNCGEDVSIEERPIGGPTTALFGLSARHDVVRTYVDQSGLDTQVVYDPGTCRESRDPLSSGILRDQDIWGFTDLGDTSRRQGVPVTGRHGSSSGARRTFRLPWAGFVRR
jgi:hypothetical protein